MTSDAEGNSIQNVREYMLENLPPYTLEAINAQEESGGGTEETTTKASPQSRALDFISDDPNSAQYPEWRLWQRFALATLFL